MNKIKSILSLLVVFGFLFNQLNAQLENDQTITKTGTTAAHFLKIGVDPRGTAMGNAYVAMNGDASSIFWNPAGLANVKGIETMFVNTNWLAETNFNYIALALNIRQIGVIGISITSLNIPDDAVRTVFLPEGTGELWDASDLAVNLTYARQLTDKFSIGGNVKYIQQSIWHATASTYAADLGALFVTPFFGTRLGASLSNYGGKMQMSGRDQKLSVDPDPDNEGNVEFVNAIYETDNFPLPLMFRVGISGEFLNTDNLRLTYGLDAMHPNDNTEAVNTGMEFAFKETFFLRGGYANLFRQDVEGGMSLGGGLHYRLWSSSTILKIDYSYVDFGRLQGVHRVSFGVKF
jgi:hypothetical protein